MDLRLDATVFDYSFVAVYLFFVIAIGVVTKRKVLTSEDYFLSGRSLPAWICALAFLSANIGATELIGMAANGSQYGLATVHYYWIGAVPAMVFLGLIMMPFYYGSKVRSVPEYLRLRFDRRTHLYQSVVFALATILVAGVNLFALALLINVLVGWPLWASIIASACVVLLYTTMGGLTATMYNEVLQFFIIVAFLIPLTVGGLARVGGIDGLLETLRTNEVLGENGLSVWGGTGLGNTTNPYGNWIALLLGMGFVNSFGYWTTNFTEVQRALSAKDMSAAQRTPIIAAIPKMLLPAIIIMPGLIAAVLVPELAEGSLSHNNALPALIGRVMPTGLVGLALAALIAAFMAGMAANVSSFNTVVTYDLWQTYVRKGRSDIYYLRVGRKLTVAGVLIAIGAAFIAARFNNIQDYLQLLQSIFSAPLFATFILGLFWKRMTGPAGLWGLVAGALGAGFVQIGYQNGLLEFNSQQAASFTGSGMAFVFDVIVSVLVTMRTQPKPIEELDGLVWGRSKMEIKGSQPAPDLHKTAVEAERARIAEGRRRPWWENPWPLGIGVLVVLVILNLTVGEDSRPAWWESLWPLLAWGLAIAIAVVVAVRLVLGLLAGGKTRYPRLSRVAFMDLRAWTSAMFVVFGLMLAGYGLFFVSSEDVDKGGGLNLDLWTGIGMLAFAAAFALWLVLRPPEVGEAKIGDPAEEVEYVFLPIRDHGESSGSEGPGGEGPGGEGTGGDRNGGPADEAPSRAAGDERGTSSGRAPGDESPGR
ncbi:MAG: sodium:solute symporter family protein [Actinomycetaceae bacterium]|nr:sodium:solute symporter family protein [Actinomycetaceae bacterium]